MSWETHHQILLGMVFFTSPKMERFTEDDIHLQPHKKWTILAAEHRAYDEQRQMGCPFNYQLER